MKVFKSLVLLAAGVATYVYAAPTAFFIFGYQYTMLRFWGEHVVFDEQVGDFRYFFPCHQEAVDWLVAKGFKKDRLYGGYMVNLDQWQDVLATLPNEVQTDIVSVVYE